jgi:transposase
MDKSKINRTFSEPFKRQKVAEIDSGKSSIAEISRLYGVSLSAIHKWIKQYSLSYKPGIKMVVQLESEAQKTEQLLKRVAELERIVGIKQLELDFANTLIKVSSQELGIDLRKDFFIKHSTDSPP